MKNLTIAALVILGAITIGCTDLEQPQQTQENIVTLTTTVTLGVDTKALTETGVKTFAAGDKIAVIYMSTGDQPVLVVSNELPDGSYGNSATFTVTPRSGFVPKAGGDVRYIYPASMAASLSTVLNLTDVYDDATINYTPLNNQDGTLASLATNCDLAVFNGTLTSDAKLPASATLTNPLAISKFTVMKNSSDDITSILIKMVINDGTTTYTVTPTTSLNTIFVAMRPITSDKTITITAKADDGSITRRYGKKITGKALNSNTIVPITLTLKEGLLTGKFSVSADKQVYFSQGHLRAITKDKGENWLWMFSHTQYDIDYYNTAIIDDDGKVSNDGEQNVSLFGWSTSSTNYGINNSEANSTYSGDFEDWGKLAIFNGGNTENSGWRTLTEEEWMYLFRARTKAAKKYGLAKYGNTHGIILLPDNYPDSAPSINYAHSDWTNNDLDYNTWEKMEAAGAVFLPTYGYRKANEINNSSSAGYYWSSTPSATDTDFAVNIKFLADEYYEGIQVSFFGDGIHDYHITSYRRNGCSVRLVMDAN